MWNAQIGDITDLDLECTTFCNLACPECNRTTDEEIISSILNTTHITLENCRDWFKPRELTSLTDVRFCGAIDEALMNPELTDILDFFKDDFKIEFIDIRTNGSVRSTKWWSTLVNHLPTKHTVIFGIDGLEDTLHIYRVGADYQKVINNAKAFIATGGMASWQFIEFEHNKHQVDEARQLAKELGFKEFRLVSSSRPTMSEDLEHIRKDDKVSALSNKVSTKVETKPARVVIHEPAQESKQEIVLIRKKEVKKERTVIQCEAQGAIDTGNRILINALSQCVPCCFLNGYLHQPVAHNKDTKNSDKPPFTFYEDPRLAELYHKHADSQNELTGISLKHNTLKEILEGPFFADIQNSWSTENPVERCLEVCGKFIKDEAETVNF
jgi:molybdenum cofactor biosynthesis enzyme MoaA